MSSSQEPQQCLRGAWGLGPAPFRLPRGCKETAGLLSRWVQDKSGRPRGGRVVIVLLVVAFISFGGRGGKISCAQTLF